jgi:hypothetical protein
MPLHIEKMQVNAPCLKWRNGRLVIYCFTSRWRIFHLYGDVTIIGERLQRFHLCSALRAFDGEGSSTCHTCCDTGPPSFRSHPKNASIYRLLQHRSGCGGSILNYMYDKHSHVIHNCSADNYAFSPSKSKTRNKIMIINLFSKGQYYQYYWTFVQLKYIFQTFF